jgi:hypothetical protein
MNAEMKEGMLSEIFAKGKGKINIHAKRGCAAASFYVHERGKNNERNVYFIRQQFQDY